MSLPRDNMKRLFNDDGTWTAEGAEISDEFSEVARKFFKKEMVKNWDIRDLSLILNSALDVGICMEIL